ncbi:hypothetical protein F4677DRAFT_437922 [Hypoxylon crocopeplum]|nr:hypothetical protein F4677DRAFT_437922 [Hypoxylon crocopeplum]
MAIKTRFFIISDTHGQIFDIKEEQRADVVIHCGDLTDESQIEEFRTTIHLLRQLPAPLKLVISGNHDLTLEEPTFKKKISEASQPIEPDLVEKDFGSFGEPRRLYEEAKDAGITYIPRRRQLRVRFTEWRPLASLCESLHTFVRRWGFSIPAWRR